MRRECEPQTRDYWEPTTDPDGCIRYRLCESERLQYLEDTRDEFDYLSTELGGGRILDVGCGPGWFMAQLSMDWECTGVEPSRIAAREATAAGIRITTSILSFDGVYDVVRCHHVIEHMARPVMELSRMATLLRAGGLLLLSTPDFGSPCAVRFGDRYRMLHDPTHCSLFTLESMLRLIKDNGLVIEDVKFPFPSRYQTPSVMQAWHDGPQPDSWSPPWPGNWFTIYARKP